MLTNPHHGDSGYTTLVNGTRIRKDAPLLVALGELEESGTALGKAVTGGYLVEEFDTLLRGAQQALAQFAHGLAEPPDEQQADEQQRVVLADLDAVCERYASGESSEPLDARSESVTHLQWARTVVRRAERTLWTLFLDGGPPQASEAAVFLNRLGDTLLVAAVRIHRGADREVPLGVCGSTV